MAMTGQETTGQGTTGWERVKQRDLPDSPVSDSRGFGPPVGANRTLPPTCRQVWN